ncbi:MAG: glycosyltransferase family 2 protein [Candidatus Omnitrophota bacterium]|jgi:glycosyltransferase involved in cell wall biosynthesis
MDISFVIPLYNESENIGRLYEEIIQAMGNLHKEYEIIFVDDGSTDASFAALEGLHHKDGRVKAIQLRRNFGKALALNSGLRHARGEIIFTMDADLQDNPQDIPYFLKKLDQGYDMVCGWRQKRQDAFLKKLFSRIFNRFVFLVTRVNIHDFNCGFKCLRKEAADSLKLYGDMHRYIPVLAASGGFRVTEIKVSHRPRIFGKSKYGSGRFIRGLFDFFTVIFITRYIYRPLHFFGLGGLLISGTGFSICSYLSILWLTGQRPIGNRPLLLLGVMLFILGIQLFSIGFIGEMLASRSSEVRKKEPVRRIIG